ncbi:MAG: DNA gyrase subunit A [Deltaproteobacteria bacterium]|nr:DNA gyrase subunit A [Deltaproteobacteria bacterium]
MSPEERPESYTAIKIEEEMKGSYLDYAMSVIVGRALPDVRDGLKPAHRRSLFAMYELHNTHDRPYKKSARVVGDVIGKYHPHGDTAVYDTIVRMAQDFSMRYPLVDGQGNFGSVDGDSPAAMRYTEVRMTPLAEELLAEIERETVSFFSNYDDSLKEPSVLPARFPNLLVNGSSGIAVGMATNIPPHNLGEIVSALLFLIEHPDATISQLCQFVHGPDFPTAGFIYGIDGIREAYEKGKGIIKLRARAELEQIGESDRERIVITEIPYQVNKARLIEQIADLVRDKKIDGITDLRDESDRDGMRIVIELRRNEIGEIILNQLYKLTQMETSFGTIFLALEHNQPKIFNLKELLRSFLDHREVVVTKRTRFDLGKARERAHILEGLKIALENIDDVVQLIKKSPSPDEARSGLMKKYSLSERQAQAILDMRLQRLTNLEREKLLSEHKELLSKIAEYEAILSDRGRILKVISTELLDIRKRYADERKTEIVGEGKEITIEDMIVDEPMVVTITRTGFVKRTPAATYRSQRRGGKGVKGALMREEDIISHFFVASPLDYMLCFTNAGRVYWLKVHQIPEATKVAKGRALVSLLRLQPGEEVRRVLLVDKFEPGKYVLFVTEKGYVKKTALDAFSNPRASGIIAIGFKEEDTLVDVRMTNGSNDVFLTTRNGKCIRFTEKDARPMGRTAAGVIGIRLSKDDKVVALAVLDEEQAGNLLTGTENGFGKRSPVSEYRRQKRGGSGIIDIKTTKRNGPVISSLCVQEDDELMLVTSEGQVMRMPVSGISTIGRNTQGVRFIQMNKGVKVTGMALLIAEEAEE